MASATPFPRDRLFLIAGPCVLEDDALNLRVAEEIARVGNELAVPVIFKASFDKANRNMPGAPRGPGLDHGLRQLERVRRETDLAVLTDVHETGQVGPAAEVCDALQIPAFLCRQTDLVRAAAQTGKPINIKKGQWMSPEAMSGAVLKATAAGARSLAITERGTFLGYGDLVVDMRSFARMRGAFDGALVFDGTHSVQRPGRADGASGGDQMFIAPLVRAAVAAGADGLFLEVHPDPLSAPSDAHSMLELGKLRDVVESALAIRAALAETEPADRVPAVSGSGSGR